MDQQLSRNSSSEMQNNVAADTMEPDQNNNLEGVNNEYWRYIPLNKAALRGDWDAAKRFFDQDANAITAPITSFSETALHIAVGTGERAIHFMEKLVELMPVEALTLRDSVGYTALHVAAVVGNMRAAVVLVQKNPDLLYIHGYLDLLPLHCAALYACKDTLLFLLTVTKDDHVSRPFSNKNVVRLVNLAISSGFYDVALNLVEHYPQLAKSKDDHNECFLQCIARKGSAFPSDVPVKLETNPIKYPPSGGDLENPAAANRRSQALIGQKYNWSIWAQILKDFSIFGSQQLQIMLWKVFKFLVPPVKHIQEQKQMHLEALTLLKCVCEEIRSSND
ncbi:uncharacterized protein LOC131327398 isoform X2 [Rhododendron vialii]|uniref:uncharacterized protein LOC131327398 isoform X2 n=1 Tax=Rhododendron vialii TaxID=182163 RepID=UPI00265E2991|nr:uncharacterized protein LOC131327398 isoform X2 [Rhododendron vialii]